MSSHYACWTINLDEANHLCIRGQDKSKDLLQKYSQFKFGNTYSVAYFSNALFQHLKLILSDENSELSRVFIRASKQREYIYFTAPGIRNVMSASNLLLNLTAMKLNGYLARRGLPTGITRTVTRLASGRANYAALPRSKRDTRAKTTQSLIPTSEYSDHPIHVIFFDDLIASGATMERTRKKSLEAGACSFTSCSIFDSAPKAAASPEFEHQLNCYDISGVLDSSVAKCLNTSAYLPVQRMLRLLLHPSNGDTLIPFMDAQIPIETRIMICSYALANDYLTIVPQKNGIGLYASSLNRLIDDLERLQPMALS